MSNRLAVGFILICAGVACVTVAHAQMQQGPAVPRFERGDSVAISGAELFDRIVYLPVTIDGRGPFTFVLDTGAGAISAIDQSVAEALGNESKPLAAGGGAGEEQVAFTRIDSASLALPGISFDARSVIGLPLHRMDPHWGKRKDGLVGGDLLSTLVMRIDYEKGRVEFHDERSYEYRGSGERIPLEVVDGFLFVRAQVLLYGGAEPVDALLLVDTGVRITTFNSPYSRTHNLAARSPRMTSGVTGYGIGGVSKGIVGRVRGIRLGSILIETPVVDFSTDESGALAADNFSGILGADILSRFNVVIDYARSQIVLEKNAAFGSPSEFDMCGIRFTMEGERFDTLRVFSLFEPSPAAEAGIQPGDLVKTIDGRSTGSFTREGLRQYMERDGKTVKLAIERGAETKVVEIRLRRLV